MSRVVGGPTVFEVIRVESGLAALVRWKGTFAVRSGNMLVVADVPQSDVVHWVRGLGVAQTGPYSLELIRGQR